MSRQSSSCERCGWISRAGSGGRKVVRAPPSVRRTVRQRISEAVASREQAALFRAVDAPKRPIDAQIGTNDLGASKLLARVLHSSADERVARSAPQRVWLSRCAAQGTERTIGAARGRAADQAEVLDLPATQGAHAVLTPRPLGRMERVARRISVKPRWTPQRRGGRLERCSGSRTTRAMTTRPRQYGRGLAVPNS